VEARLIARAVAVGRIGLGAGLVIAPQRFTNLWLGHDSGRAGTQVVSRGLGARDIALGVGALTADESQLGAWAAGAVMADAADLVATIAAGLVRATDADAQDDAARKMFDLPANAEPTDEQLKKAADPLKRAASLPLMSRPKLRKLILDLRQKFEQMVDELSKDELVGEHTGLSEDARNKAAALVKSFEAYLSEHKDKIDALQFFYSVPHKKRLRYKDLKALADAISTPPRSWTPEKLWRAYETLAQSKVRGASAGRLLVDMVSLVRFALHKDTELAPHADRVRERFDEWLAQQDNRGKVFTSDQRRWLEMMRDHIATSVDISIDDFDLTPFAHEGGLARVTKVFGEELEPIVRELNLVLAA